MGKTAFRYGFVGVASFALALAACKAGRSQAGAPPKAPIQEAVSHDAPSAYASPEAHPPEAAERTPTRSSEPGRSAEDIQALVASHREEARACYDKALAEHPGIEGTLDIKWVIDPQGNVVDASVDTTKSDILEPSVGACVVNVLTKIKFAPTSRGYETRVHYPFKFAPRRGQRKDAGS